MDTTSIIQHAKETIRIEAAAIEQLLSQVDDSFARTVRLIQQRQGRVVISGIGKSALIAQKIVATLNSTGTPSIFLHAADAIHGDLGMLQQDDIAILISKSGESPEIRVLVPLIKKFGNPLIALCGNPQSFLAREADEIIHAAVDQEACPNNLAPTSSTTAQLVMGDALAVCLLKEKGFSPQDFARFHPGGALGKQLYLRVGDLSTQNEVPRVQEDAGIKEVILEITGKRLGATAILNAAGKLCGVITDGDIRRMLEKYPDSFMALHASDIMHQAPKTISSDELAVNALSLMRAHNISQVLVTDQDGYCGILHLHDLIREGLV